MWNYLKYEITVILRNINFEIYAVNLNTYRSMFGQRDNP